MSAWYCVVFLNGPNEWKIYHMYTNCLYVIYRSITPILMKKYLVKIGHNFIPKDLIYRNRVSKNILSGVIFMNLYHWHV